MSFFHPPLEQRLINSTEWLDTNYPNWPSLIVLETLHIERGCQCVVAQVTGLGYMDACKKHPELKLGNRGLQMAFSSFENSETQRRWVNIIKIRKAQ